RSVMVELNEGFAGDGEPPADGSGESAAGVAQVPGAGVAQVFRPAVQGPAAHGPATEAPPVPIGDQAEGVRLVGQILKNATNARWPMYVRNVKQLLRAYRGDNAANGDGASAGFDERQYGFGGLMDLLRACQKEGLLRVERDRRGGLRVFPGASLQRTEVPRAAISQETAQEEPITIEQEAMESEQAQPSAEPIPIDTTAELLGRAGAKPRRSRQPSSRAGAPAPRAPRKPAAVARKPATRRVARPNPPGPEEHHQLE